MYFLMYEICISFTNISIVLVEPLAMRVAAGHAVLILRPKLGFLGISLSQESSCMNEYEFS